jgi:hypothetical protein
LEGVHTSKALPEDVLKLADLFWTYTKKEEDHFYGSQIDIGRYFGLDNDSNKYQPFVQSYQSQRLHTAVLIY